jgi:uncharacterized iron-regulated membrane protein
MDRKRLRKIINNLHLWLGLGSGLILFLVCLSGTVYTFRSEIERWLEPEKYYSSDQSSGKRISADSIVSMVENNTGGKITSLMIPGDPSMNWQAAVKKGSSTPDKAGRPKTYFINPFTAEIAGEQGGGTSEFFTKVMQMHRWLMMEDSGGRIIVGSATLIFVFMILSGLVLWFPAQLRNLKRVLTVKTSGNWKRINHDLHNTIGFYSFLLLLVISLTGLCWSFEWYKEGLSNVLGAAVFKGKNEKPPESKASSGVVSFEGVLSGTGAIFPYTGNSRLTIPETPATAVTVTKSATGFFALAGADKAQFDAYTGAAIKIERFSDKPLNVKIADSIKLIHTGEIFGTFSKILYFIVCLMATSLPVTGTFIWLNKMKKKQKPVKSAVNKKEELV